MERYGECGKDADQNNSEYGHFLPVKRGYPKSFLGLLVALKHSKRVFSHRPVSTPLHATLPLPPPLA